MKTGALIVTCVAGLAIGALAGRSLRASKNILAGDSVAAVRTHSGPEDSRAKGASAFADTADDRIARLFTALKEPSTLVQHFELFEATRAFTADDLPGLVKRAESLPLELKSEMMIALMTRWFELDPAAAEQWMLERPDFGWGIEAWARANPESAIRAALATPASLRSRKVIFAAIEKLAGKKPEAQAAQLRELPPGPLRDQVFAEVLKKWSDIDPAAAFSSLAEMSPGGVRDSAREDVMLKWAKKDPAKALAQLDAILPTLKAGVLGNELVIHAASAIAEKNPRLVADWLSQIPVEFRDAAGIAAAGIWARKEPAAALDWCMTQGVDAARGNRQGFNMSMSSVLGEAISNAPAATIAWLDAQPVGPERERLIERAFSETWKSGKEDIFRSEGKAPMRLFNELPQDAQVRTAREIGERRGMTSDSSDLSAWAHTFAPGPARAEAFSALFGSTYGHDASRADALLSQVAVGADRDAALRGLTTMMTYSAPAAAATRALGIADSAVRRETLDTVMKTWLKRDPAASRAWLQDSSAIPAAWKEPWLRAR